MAEKMTARAQINRLRRDCAEVYQVMGAMIAAAGMADHPQAIKALDNLSAAANGQPRPHEDLLPFQIGDTPRIQ
jgi:hypothetical protein